MSAADPSTSTLQLPRDPLRPTVNGVDERRVLAEVEAAGRGEGFDPRPFLWTGSDLSRVVLADGQAFVLKHFRPEGDWLARASHGIGRAQLLWRSGVLSELDPVVEHGVVGIVEFDGVDALVMHDLTGRVNAPDCYLGRGETEKLMAAMARLHEFGADLVLPELCSTFDYLNVMNPALARADRGPGRFEPGAEGIQQGLSYLAAKIGGDAGDALASFYDNIASFEATVLAAGVPMTLLHGDTRSENLGVADGRLVAVDWGEMTWVGPREFDVVGFIIQSVEVHTEATPDEMRGYYDQHASVPLDEGMLQLAWVRQMANYGLGNVAELAATQDPAERERARSRIASTIDAFRHIY